MTFLDPDRRLFSRDKFEHALGAAVLMIPALLLFSPFHAFLAVALLGITFELGQWDAVRGTEYLGRVGYGFSPLDLAADLLGAGIMLGLYSLVA